MCPSPERALEGVEEGNVRAQKKARGRGSERRGGERRGEEGGADLVGSEDVFGEPLSEELKNSLCV